MRPPAAGQAPTSEGLEKRGREGRTEENTARGKANGGVRPELRGAAAPFLSLICRDPREQRQAGETAHRDQSRGIDTASPRGNSAWGAQTGG